jgi:hypothetical protein
MESADKSIADERARQPAAERVASRGPVAAFVDSRPEATAQRQLAVSIEHSPRMVAQRRRLDTLGVVQRVVSASATYAPQAAALVHIGNLDAQVANAEQDAANEIQNPAGGLHTARQANYIRNPTPMTWGYCVEEQLDPVAMGLGWTTQHPMPGSRPDYYKTVGTVEVFADLTTAGQAAPAGNHITGKLAATAHNYPNANQWEAADLIHSGQRPGGGVPPPVQTNGIVTHVHAQHFQRYRAYLGDNSVYDGVLDHVVRVYGRVSSGTFTQTWDAQDRDDFVDEFNVQSDSDESDYAMDSDEERM